MSFRNASRVVSFPADEVTEAIRATAEGSIRSVVEYDTEEFNPLYVDDVTLSLYKSEDHMMAHFEKIHSYVHLDVAEMDLFVDELFPIADRVRYLSTSFDVFTLLRVYIGREGVFAALEPGEPVEPIVEAVERAARS